MASTIRDMDLAYAAWAAGACLRGLWAGHVRGRPATNPIATFRALKPWRRE